MSDNLRHLSHHQHLDENLFTAVASAVQPDLKTSNDRLKILAEKSRFSEASLHGTASFYDFLTPAEKSKSTQVCHGTACLMNGSSSAIASTHLDASKAMCCGYCYQGAGLLQRDSKGVLHSYHQGKTSLSQTEMPVYDLSTHAILTGTVDDISSLYQIALDKQKNILPELEQSELRGRGGAGFAFSFKCNAVTNAESDEKYIVCNADEGDPGAFSDRYLLEQQPHKVMAGMFAAGVASGAKVAVLYIRYEYPEAIREVEQAIVEYEALQLENDFKFYVIAGAGSYVCGEETALLSSIEGLRPEVRVRPPYPAQSGLWGKPTLVSNVETYANIPWILQHGGNAFSSIGTSESKGSKLISLDSQFVRAGLYEVDFGYVFDELIKQAGGFKLDVKALQVGGPLGSILPIRAVASLKIAFETFQKAGFALGHAGIIAIPKSFPMIKFMHHIFDYMTEESCGKCTPCRLGTAKGTLMLEHAQEDKPIDKQLFAELLDILEVGSLCALGGGLPLPMRNALTHFENELSPYFTSQEDAS